MKKYLSLAMLALNIAFNFVLDTTDAQETTHSFLACGQNTYIVNAEGKTVWTYPHPTRDGYRLDDGRVVLTLNQGKRYPGGAVIEVGTDGQESLIWKGTQDEVNSAHPTPEGTFVITEAGPKPRLLELDHDGKVLVEFPLACQKPNPHMQTRMARKLPNGTYLAPHLLDFAVKQYDAQGIVTWELDTSVAGDEDRAIHSWPFTAIRHGDGHTLVCCTNGNRVIDFDAEGEVVWQLTNEDLPGPWLQDPCGGQVLPNGNVVIASYAGGRKDPSAPKLIEVNRNKEVVWTYSDGQQIGIHHFEIFETNGKPLVGPAMK